MADPLEQGEHAVEWKYHMRYECQEILPFLYLGPSEAGKSLPTLLSLGITSIIVLRSPSESFFLKPRFPDRFAYLVLDVTDNENENLIKIYPRAKEFIFETMRAQGKVLVHCVGGISRAPALVTMFLMEYKALSCDEAFHYVQSRRYCAHLSPGFSIQMREFEPIYKAAQTIAGRADLNAPPDESKARRKREMEIDSDGEGAQTEVARRRHLPPESAIAASM